MCDESTHLCFDIINSAITVFPSVYQVTLSYFRSVCRYVYTSQLEEISVVPLRHSFLFGKDVYYDLVNPLTYRFYMELTMESGTCF